MSFTPEEKLTIDYYNREAQTWKQGRDGSDFWAEEISKLRSLVESGRLLEIGSGVGREAADLAKWLDYTGVDVATGLLAIAQQNNPELKFVQASAYELPFEDETFDAVWTAATLIHIPKSKISLAIAEIRRVMKPGAVGFVSVKRGDNEMVQEGIAYGRPSKRFYANYEPDELEQVLSRSGLEMISMSEKASRSRTVLTGDKAVRPTVWLACFFRKP